MVMHTDGFIDGYTYRWYIQMVIHIDGDGYTYRWLYIEMVIHRDGYTYRWLYI